VENVKTDLGFSINRGSNPDTDLDNHHTAVLDTDTDTGNTPALDADHDHGVDCLPWLMDFCPYR